MSGASEGVALREAQDARRLALIERLGVIADLACASPFPGELGDVAYDLLRQAAAQISSDRLHIARLTPPPSRSYAEGVEDADVARIIDPQAFSDYAARCEKGQDWTGWPDRRSDALAKAAAIRLLPPGGKA